MRSDVGMDPMLPFTKQDKARGQHKATEGGKAAEE
jgi:hypothetical protein